MEMMFHRIASALWLVVHTLLAVPHASADPVRTLDHYHHQSWTSDDGAPPDIWSIDQSDDGFLWLATGAGLYRFDGVAFEAFEPLPGQQFLSIDVTSVFSTSGGDLWLGYSSGGASLLREGRLTHFTEAHGLRPGRSVQRFQDDGRGGVWVATLDGLRHYRDGAWTIISSDWAYPGRRADWIEVSDDGTLWASTGETLAYLSPGSSSFTHTGLRLGKAVFSLTPDGRIWINDELQGLMRVQQLPSGEFSAESVDGGPADMRGPNALIIDQHGGVWYTDKSKGGVTRVRETHADQAPVVEDRFSQSDGLSADIASPIFEDREGNIWVGSNHGLDRFRQSRFVRTDVIMASSPTGFSIAESDNAAYVIDAAKIHQIGGERTIVLADAPSVKTWFSLVDRSGTLRISSQSGLWQYADGALTQPVSPAGNANGQVWSMAEDTEGAVWVSVALEQEGIYVQGKGGDWVKQPEPEAVSDDYAVAAAADATGNVWFGYTGRRLVRYGIDGPEVFGAESGLSVGDIQVLHFDGETLFVGGERGLARWMGNGFQSIDTERVPQLMGISGIVDTEDGCLWLNTLRGVVEADQTELGNAFNNRAYTPEIVVYDHRDGLSGVAQQSLSGGTAKRTRDGRLWFVTNTGVYWMDTADIVPDRLPPPVSFLGITVEGQRFPLEAGLTLPKNTKNVGIDYTAVNLSSPERTRFRYKIDGIDSEWVDAGAARSAHYSNLGPGLHVFRVMAANERGVWNHEGASLAFYIPPTFVQTRFFWVMCAIAGVLTVLALISLRSSYLARRVQEKYNERLLERERIARELHDTLLQGFQGLILRMQAVANDLPSTFNGKKSLEETLDRAEQTLVESRESITNLRTSRAKCNLPTALALAAEELARDFPTRFRVDVEGSRRELHPLVRAEIEKLGREAMANAFKHARAQKIAIELSYRPNEFRLRVIDDGVGMEEGVSSREQSAGHFGLQGMRERAREIRATFTINSKRGAGTEILVSCPATIAYADERPGKRSVIMDFARFFRP
jgi:signal transduction histidine kinase/ligand-binding sensor domain-containing protein